MIIYLLFLAVITVNVEYTDGTIGVLECDTSEPIVYYPNQRFITVDQCRNVRGPDVIFKDSFED